MYCPNSHNTRMFAHAVSLKSYNTQGSTHEAFTCNMFTPIVRGMPKPRHSLYKACASMHQYGGTHHMPEHVYTHHCNQCVHYYVQSAPFPICTKTLINNSSRKLSSHRPPRGAPINACKSQAIHTSGSSQFLELQNPRPP